MHSKGKLALAVFTSPGAAFEEILERRLLGTALWIVGLTGLMAMLAAIGRGIALTPLEFFTLGLNNPITWFGLFLLYAMALGLLLKWINAEADFVKILIVMGWSQLALLIAQIAGTITALLLVGADHSNSALQVLDFMRLGFNLWYAVIIGFGLKTAFGIRLDRAILSYVVTWTALFLGFSYTYGNAKLSPFVGSPTGIMQTAGQIARVDQTPWMVAGIVGLLLGLWKLSKELKWDKSFGLKVIAGAAVVGVFSLGYYVSTMMDTDYYGKVSSADKQLLRAEDTYEDNPAEGRKTYGEAAAKMEELLPIIKSNGALMLDIADTYYLADSPKNSISYYEKFQAEAEKAQLPATEGSNLASVTARVHSSIGAVYYQQGEYDKALAEFDKASKAWPKFRDPWIRKAVTYDRMGEYDKAIEAGNHAVQKLGSESPIAWVALAQAFVQTGDKKQTGVAITMVSDKDKDIAKQIGSKSDDWKDAVEKLTDQNLRYPLEKTPAPAPEQPKAKGKAGEKKEPGKK